MTKVDFWVKRYCGIYCIQNKTTGMAYVGQSVDIVKRWSAHTTPGKKSSGIQKAIKEAGIEAFHFFVLEICAREDLNDREIHWIKTYDCVNPKGYNGNSGGGAPTKVSDETKKKISAACKGKKKSTQSTETKTKRSSSLKGRKVSDETRAKISAALNGKKMPPRSTEHLAKILIAIKGKKKSTEHCAKISAAKKEYWAKKKVQAFHKD
jgi:group I intron endonuclease